MTSWKRINSVQTDTQTNSVGVLGLSLHTAEGLSNVQYHRFCAQGTYLFHTTVIHLNRTIYGRRVIAISIGQMTHNALEFKIRVLLNEPHEADHFIRFGTISVKARIALHVYFNLLASFAKRLYGRL